MSFTSKTGGFESYDSHQLLCSWKVEVNSEPFRIARLTRGRWERWRNELYLLESLKVPRSFKPSEFGRIVSTQLHCMSDASTCGYGQCSYLRLEDEHGKVHVSFVMGKARVMPKKTVSIPRLELVAASVSVKIGNVLKDELEYENIEDHY